MVYVSFTCIAMLLVMCLYETNHFVRKLSQQRAQEEKTEEDLLRSLEEIKIENISLQDQLNVINETIEGNHNDNITYLTHEKIIQSKAHELAIKRYNLQEGLNLKTISMKDKALMSILLDRETCKIGQQLKEIKLRKQQSNST